MEKAQQAYDKAQSGLRQTETAQATAAQAFQQASQSAAKKHSDGLGLPAAAAAVQTAEVDAKQASQSLMAVLENKPDYQAAAQAASRASEDLGKLNDDQSLAVSKYEERSRQLTAVIRRPLDIKRQAMDRDPACQQAKRRLQEAQRKLALLETKYKKALAAEPEVVRAREALKSADNALESARQRAAQAAQALASAKARAGW